MDRSFLSQPEVTAAARRFVCIRLTTYEDADEGALLQALCPTRSGELENTVFALLSPDGKRPLARPSRSARDTFGDAARMAEAMHRIADVYKNPASPAPGILELPTVPTVRLALNVAACDNVPLVVLFGPDAKVRQALEDRLLAIAGDTDVAGRCVFARAATTKELAALEGAEPTAGVLVVQPGRFGLTGTVLRQISAEAPPGDFAQRLRGGLALHHRTAETFAAHVRTGHRQGVFWETVMPVTDPMEQQARQHGKHLP
jgi:hypothetical protein